MQAFNDQLTIAMSRIGRTIDTISYGSNGGRVILRGVNGEPSTVVNYNGGRDSSQVIFLNGFFSRRSREGNRYDTDRAVGMLLGEESRTKAVRLEREKRKKLEEQRMEWRRYVASLNARLRDSGVCVELLLNDEEGYKVTTIARDQATVQAMIDYLNDGGFTNVKKPEPPTEPKE